MSKTKYALIKYAKIPGGKCPLTQPRDALVHCPLSFVKACAVCSSPFVFYSPFSYHQVFRQVCADDGFFFVSDNIHDSSHCLFLRDVVSLYPSMPLFVFLDYVLPPRDNMMPLLVISCRPFLLYMTKPCQSSLSDPVDQYVM